MKNQSITVKPIALSQHCQGTLPWVALCWLFALGEFSFSNTLILYLYIIYIRNGIK